MDSTRDKDISPPAEPPSFRLSESPLFDAQHRYYIENGIEPFRTGVLPHQITNNPAFARAYASVVLGFVRDAVHEKRLAPGETFYIVELGSGMGRFGYQFCRAFFDLLSRSPVAGVPVRYVLTDFTQHHLDFWKQHEALRPLVERGLVDFALFDAEKGESITLECAGTRIGPDAPVPLAVITNYVLDSLRMDAFSFIDGGFYECLVSVDDRAPPVAFGERDYFERIPIRFDRRPASLSYYPEPEFNAILSHYASILDDSTVLFPTFALRCLDRLTRFARGPLLFLTGDKGFFYEQALADRRDPHIAAHGSFSMPVNYHAIGAYVEGRGGVAMQQPHADTYLHVGAFVLGAGTAATVETRFAFHEAFGRSPPEDFRNVRAALECRHRSLDPEQLLSLVRLGGDDPALLFECLPALYDRVHDFDGPPAHDLHGLVRRAWENYYFIGEPEDVPFGFGVLLYCAEYPKAAAAMFLHSLRLFGECVEVLANLAACRHAEGRPEDATAYLERAAALDPTFQPPATLLMKVTDF